METKRRQFISKLAFTVAGMGLSPLTLSSYASKAENHLSSIHKNNSSDQTRWGEWKLLDNLLEGWGQTDTGCVLKVDGVYHMIYNVTAKVEGVGGEWFICHATSQNGIDWIDPKPVLRYSDEVENSSFTGSSDPSVLNFNGAFHMWYVYKLKGGYNKTDPVPERQWQIGYATSKNCIDWIDKTDSLHFHPTLKNDFFKATHGLEPRVVYIDEKTLWMYYIKDFSNSVTGTFRTVSHDGGLTWGPQEMGEGMHKMDRCWHVFWYKGNFHSVYSLRGEHPGNIYIADSKDGLNWENHRLFVDDGSWSDANCIYPAGIKEDFPQGLCKGNTLESDDWIFLIKTLHRPYHRMGLARNLNMGFYL